MNTLPASDIDRPAVAEPAASLPEDPTGRSVPSEDALPEVTCSQHAPPLDPAVGDERALSELERAVLDFEHQWWRHAGSKEQAVRDRFGLSPTRYYQLLNSLLDHPEALKNDPMLIKRLRRVRASRRVEMPASWAVMP